MKFWKIWAAFLILKSFGLVSSDGLIGSVAVTREGYILQHTRKTPYVVTEEPRKKWKGYCAIEPAEPAANRFKKEWGFYNRKTGRVAVGFSIQEILLRDKIRELEEEVAWLEKVIDDPAAIALVDAQQEAKYGDKVLR